MWARWKYVVAAAVAFVGTMTESSSVRSFNGTIVALELINAKTDTKLFDLVNGTVVVVADIASMDVLPSFNLLARVTTHVTSVRYTHNGVATRRSTATGSVSALTFCGIQPSNGTKIRYRRCRRLVYGTHVVTAIPYREGEAPAGPPLTVSFTVVKHSGSTGTLPLDPEAPKDQADVTPPQLVHLAYRNGTQGFVNVTQGNSVVSLAVTVRDDDSGVASGYVAAYDRVRNVFHASDALALGRPVARRNVTFHLNLVLQQATPTGVYDLQVYLVDAAGNEVDINASAALRDGASTIAVQGVDIDDVPPLLINVTALTPTRFDASQPNDIVFSVLVLDVGSGFETGLMRGQLVDSAAAEPYTVQESFSNVIPNASATFPTEYSVTFQALTLARAPAGNYSLSFDLVDAVGNIASLDANVLLRRNFPTTMEVVGTTLDDVPPELVDFVALSPTTIDANATVQFQTVARDATSGLSTVYLEVFRSDTANLSAYRPGDGEFYDAQLVRLSDPTPGALVVTNFSIFFSPFVTPGSYILQLSLIDAADRSMFYEAIDLQDLGYPALITVLGSSSLEDTTPPTLVNLYATTATTVTVATTDVTIAVVLELQDDVSGVAIGTLIGSPSLTSKDLIGAALELSDAQRDASIVTPYALALNVTIPADSPAGTYFLTLELFDVAGNFMFYTTESLAALGFLDSVQVVRQ